MSISLGQTGSPSFASAIGAIVGGTIGGVVLLIVFVSILSCIIIKQHKITTRIRSTGTVNFSTTRQTVVAPPPTTSVPTQPQQPPADFTLPRPE